MTVGEWMPALVAILTIGGAAATYAYQRRVDRQVTLMEKRREVFTDYIVAFQRNISGNHDNEAYQTAYARIAIYGTDQVVRATSAFHNLVADRAGQIDGEQAADAYATMLSAMRAECFSASHLSTAEMKHFLPFGY
jgi:hypothetical protein